MDYLRIEAALERALEGVQESISLTGQYLQTFMENEINDDLLQECLDEENRQLLKEVDNVIPIIGHRIKFYKAFKVAPNEKQNDVAMHQRRSKQPSPVPIDLNKPQPVQIMDFDELGNSNRSEIVFHKNMLRQILTKAWNKKIAVLAITGPSRKGKSYFLNFIIRYLNTQKSNNPDWMGRKHSNDSLDGFKWQNCTERVTKGIWVWSELFTMKAENGEEFDLLIMDSQGVFDEHTTHREWSILVGLELLTSSCLIFNIVGDLQEDSLLNFEHFLSFGLMSLENHSSTPFQNLVFLIRDWNIPDKHHYGLAGGQAYISTKLDTKSCHKESHKRVRQQLRKCFENISCFLLPHPGESVLAQNFNGLDTKSEKFTSEIAKCVPELVDSMKFCLKKINGHFLTGEDILNTFQLYSDLFNSDTVPNPQSLFEVSVQSCNAIVTKKCVEAFEKELNGHLGERTFVHENDLLVIKGAAETSAVAVFQISKKMGDEATIQQAKEQLLERIEISFVIIKERNAYNFNQAVFKAIDIAVTDYKNFMSEGLQNRFLSDEAVDSLSLEGEEQALHLFTTSCGVGSVNLLSDEIEELQQLLRSKKQEFINKNLLNKRDAVEDLERKIQDLVRSYKESMKDVTKGRIVLKKDIAQLHDTQKTLASNEFDQLGANLHLVEDAKKNLETKIDDEYALICNDILNFNDMVMLESDSLITKVASNYFDCVKTDVSLNRQKFEELKNVNLKSAQETVTFYTPLHDADFLANLFQLLNGKIEKFNLELEELIQRKEKELKTELNDVKEIAVKDYSAALDDMLASNEQIVKDPDALDEIECYEKRKTTELLQKRVDNICKTYGADTNLFESYMVQLEHSFKEIYDSIKRQNTSRKEITEAQAHVILSQTKEAYVKQMKEAVENVTDEDDLNSTHDRIMDTASDNLMNQLNALPLSPQLSNKLKTDLHSYIEDEFEGTLEVFRMKIREDEDAVKNALLEARLYYNEEMEKHFQSKDWLEEREMQTLHDTIIETAIERGRTQVDLSDHQEKQLREAMNVVLKKYEEKNLLRKPTDSYAIGIDLGTTYSCVAVCVRGKVKIISQDQKTTVPSYVAFKDDHTVDVGEAAKEQTFRHPESTIFDVKRLIGRKFYDQIVQDDIKLWPFDVVNDDDQPKIKIPNHSETYRPEQISARVLAYLKKMAEDYLKRTVTNAVITVPAYFSDSQRQATKDAAEISGLNAKILNEPTAAAIAYQLHRTDDLKRNILVFDLGGGTFDVEVLNVQGGNIVVKAIGGDTHLGGEDFDNEIVKHIIDVVKDKHNIDLGRGRDSSNLDERKDASERIRRLKAVCEKQKRILSYSESTEIVIPRIDGTFNLELPFTRVEFERLNLSRFKQCIDMTSEVISNAHLEKNQIEDIVLVGGSTRIPKIRELLAEYFDGKALNCQINADEAVAYGAAIQAALEYGKSDEVGTDIKVSDVTPIPLGIKVYNGDMSVIIPKNTPIPHNKSSKYYTAGDGLTSVAINVFEGEKLIAEQNNHLGKFVLRGIPSARAGKEKLVVSMNIDKEGILFVNAVCRSTGSSDSIRIETHKGRMSNTDKKLAESGVAEYTW